MRTKDIQGIKLYRMPAADRRTRKDGTPREPKKLGRVHFPVFTPDGRRVVGFMVTPPDIAGVVKQADRFVALDCLKVYEGVFAIEDRRDAFDAPAAKRLGIDLDACIIWVGMDVKTRSGKVLGYCADASFDAKTGRVKSFSITTGSAATALLGTVEMPASALDGYAEATMVVDDAVEYLEPSGGAAAKAAETTAKIGAKVSEGARVLDEKGSAAVEKGTRALGKQLGRTRGMFGAFKDEFKKAAGPAPKKAAGSTSKKKGSTT